MDDTIKTVAPPGPRPPTLAADDWSGQSRWAVSSRRPPTQRPALPAPLYYPLLIVACGALLYWAMELWRADPRVPLAYSGDTPFNLTMVRMLVESPTYLHEDRLGTPIGLDLNEFEVSNALHIVIIKLLGLVTDDYVVTTNGFFLLTFPLAAVSAAASMRALGVSASTAFVFSLLYAFLPYHFFRGLNHLFLSAYYMVPPAVLVALWVWNERASSEDHQRVSGWRRLWPRFGRRDLVALGICFLLGMTGIYYAFFGCIFIGAAGVARLIATRDPSVIVRTAAFFAAVGLGLAIGLAPMVTYIQEHGSNPKVAQRLQAESELYALKIVHVLLPFPGHRFTPLAEVADRYYGGNPPVVSTPGLASLGTVPAAGFVGLLVLAIFAGVRKWSPLVGAVVTLNLTAVLVATIGGFGSLFALLVSPQIRAYDRMGVYIGFFSLLLLAIAVDRLRRWWARGAAAPMLTTVTLGGILVFGMLDQTSPRFVPNHEGLQRLFAGDREYVRAIEAQMPPEAMIFQLPYHSFPEAVPLFRLQAYDHLRGFLHSSSLSWSYGVMRGRGDEWLETVSRQPTEAMLPRLTEAGFDGVYVDRFGYQDGGQRIESELAERLGVAPMVSADGRRAFFSLASVAARSCGTRLDFDDLVPGVGWSVPERTPNGVSFLWMAAPEATVSLDPGAACAGPLAVELGVHAAVAPDILQSLAIRVNGQAIALDGHSGRDGELVLRGTVPEVAERPRGLARLELSVNRMMQPPDDGRSLAVALDWLWIGPHGYSQARP